MRAPRTHVHFMFNMCILTFPYAFLPRNHEHFMNRKDRKPFEERAAPWAGLKTWPAIAVDQDTASRTKRGEPNLWTHFGKRECGCLLVRYVVSNTWSSRTEVDCLNANFFESGYKMKISKQMESLSEGRKRPLNMLQVSWSCKLRSMHPKVRQEVPQ